jgi:aspartate 1-decarboxylase
VPSASEWVPPAGRDTDRVEQLAFPRPARQAGPTWRLNFLPNQVIVMVAAGNLGRIRVQRFMLKSKIHRATLTGAELDYEGSIAIDRDLMAAADLLPGEQVHVLNLSNGQRLITYVIEAPAGSGTMLLNGPAARLGIKGDLVVILAYCAMGDDEARKLRPKIVHVDERNRVV